MGKEETRRIGQPASARARECGSGTAQVVLGEGGGGRGGRQTRQGSFRGVVAERVPCGTEAAVRCAGEENEGATWHGWHTETEQIRYATSALGTATLGASSLRALKRPIRKPRNAQSEGCRRNPTFIHG